MSTGKGLVAEAAIDKYAIIPRTMQDLALKLRRQWGLPFAAIGMMGDSNHRSGYHRSRLWIQTSPQCTNRSYSVSETEGNRGRGSDLAVSAIDITLPLDLLVKVCRRLDRAVRGGQLEKVTEWYGNLGGNERVDGYDNIRNRVATSDKSHLWHVHISLDRGRNHEQHDDIFDILTGRATVPGDNEPSGGRDDHREWIESMTSKAPIVGLHSHGRWVWTIQGLLCARGQTVEIDGDFGPETRGAVMRLQGRSAGLTVDGVVGPATWPRLWGGS